MVVSMPRLSRVLRQPLAHVLYDPQQVSIGAVTTSAQRQSWMAKVRVRNQDQTGDCVAYSSAVLRQYLDVAAGIGDNFEYSAVYLYARGHLLADSSEAGMDPTWALRVLQQYGDCPQSLDPMTPSEDVADEAASLRAQEASLTPAMDAAAAQHKITSWGGVTFAGGTVGSGAAQFAAAIDRAPILIDLPVAQSTTGIWFPAQYDGEWIASWPTDGTNPAIAGDHQIIAYDYRTAVINGEPHFQLLCRNSWGASWASGGDVWLDTSYPIITAWSMWLTTPSPTPVPTPTTDCASIVTEMDGLVASANANAAQMATIAQACNARYPNSPAEAETCYTSSPTVQALSATNRGLQRRYADLANQLTALQLQGQCLDARPSPME